MTCAISLLRQHADCCLRQKRHRWKWPELLSRTKLQSRKTTVSQAKKVCYAANATSAQQNHAWHRAALRFPGHDQRKHPVSPALWLHFPRHSAEIIWKKIRWKRLAEFIVMSRHGKFLRFICTEVKLSQKYKHVTQKLDTEKGQNSAVMTIVLSFYPQGGSMFVNVNCLMVALMHNIFLICFTQVLEYFYFTTIYYCDTAQSSILLVLEMLFLNLWPLFVIWYNCS